MTQSVWDDPSLKTGDYFSWKDKPEGTSIAGVIQDIRTHTFVDPKTGPKVAPQLLLTTDNGEEITLTASQVQTKLKLQELRPDVGDHIKVTLTRIEPRGGGKTLKHFDVNVTRKADLPDGRRADNVQRGKQGFSDDPPF